MSGIFVSRSWRIFDYGGEMRDSDLGNGWRAFLQGWMWVGVGGRVGNVDCAGFAAGVPFGDWVVRKD